MFSTFITSFFSIKPKLSWFLISCFINLIFFIALIFLIISYMKVQEELLITRVTLTSFEIKMEQKFSVFENKLLLLKDENFALIKKLNHLTETASQSVLLNPISQPGLDVFITSKLLLFKILLVIIVLFSLYYLFFGLQTYNYAFFYKSLTLKFTTFLNALWLDFADHFGFVDSKKILFSDKLGNDFLVAISGDYQTIDIFIKTPNMAESISITDYLFSISENVDVLKQHIEVLTEIAVQSSTGISTESVNTALPVLLELLPRVNFPLIVGPIFG